MKIIAKVIILMNVTSVDGTNSLINSVLISMN